MIRNSFLNVRLNESERQIAEAVADRLERNGSDLVRYLLRKEAREMGILSSGQNEGRPRLSQQSALREA